jgi:hypothetical protein
MDPPAGPREENVVIWSAWIGVDAPVSHVARTVACASRNESKVFAGSEPSTITVGSQKLSVNRSWCEGLYRIIPAAPPARTSSDFSIRVTVPRSHTTTRFVTDPGSIGVLQRGSPYPATSPPRHGLPRDAARDRRSGQAHVAPSEARS